MQQLTAGIPRKQGHYRCHCRYRHQRTILVLALLLLATSLVAQTPDRGRGESPRPAPRQIHLVRIDLNLDGIPDTVLGYSDTKMRVVPTGIGWGRDPNNLALESMTVTPIIYPEWEGLGISLAAGRFTTDGSDGIILHIWGRDRKGGGDTSRGILLPAQRGLELLSKLNLAEHVQERSVVLLDLQPERDYVEPAIRDLSGRTSYRLQKVPYRLPGAGTPPLVDTLAPSHREPHVAVFPNPSAGEATLRIEDLTAGSCRVELVALDGRRMSVQNVESDGSGDLLRKLDLAALPSGSYLVYVTTTTGSIGSCTITITR